MSVKKRSYIGLALGALVAVGAVLSLSSCGFKKQLVLITVNPSTASITGAGVIVDFQALGTYIHPPETVNITESVVWASTAPQIISIVSNTGVATSGTSCGTVTITATEYSDMQNDTGSVVVGTALVTVTPPSGTCP
jgi:hypothetical protein